MSAWNPGQYLKFADERTRAAADLLARAPLDGFASGGPARVVDVGCGPGNSTALLAARYPGALVEGVDSSPEMLDEARKALPGVAFSLADLAHWSPPADTDVLFGNAVFQWVPDHLAVMARLLQALRPGAALLVQMPDNLHEPSHRLMRETAARMPFADKLAAAIARRAPLAPVGVYYDALRQCASEIDIWTTVYQHPMAGAAAVVEWVKGTGLRPFLEPLTMDERAVFLAAYQAAVAEIYPLQADGVLLLPFPRRFIVVRRTT